jgi:hypothetical protein
VAPPDYLTTANRSRANRAQRFTRMGDTPAQGIQV